MQPIFKVNIFPVYSPIQEGFSFEAIQENFAYILDREGWKLFKRNGVSISLISIKDKLEELPKLEEYIQLTAAKIPLILLQRVTAFFTAVYKKHQSEAVGYLYYNPLSGEWDFIPPVQTATAASASYEEAPKKEGWMIAGTIHSHGKLSAFHSGTDHDDEKNFDGIHITVGNVDDIPEYSCSLIAQEVRLKYEDLSELIQGVDPIEDVPAEWMEAIKLPRPTKLISDSKVGIAVEKLYDQYLDGKMTESVYLTKLKKFEDKVQTFDTPADYIYSSPAPTSSYNGSGKQLSARDFVRYHKWGQF